MLKKLYQVSVQSKANLKCTTFYWKSDKETEEEAKKEVEAQMPEFEVFFIYEIKPTHAVIL